MKHIFRNAIYGMVLTTTLVACDLDTAPTTSLSADAVFGSTEDAEKVLTGAWRNLHETFYTYRNPGWSATLLTSDAMGSDVVVNTRYGYRDMYAMTALYGKTNNSNELSWELGYRTINNANGVIANVTQASGSQSDINRIKGQALALRGYIYLHYASLYSFAIDKDPDAVCVPIYTEPTDEETALTGKPASSVSEVYSQAINDLEEALALIPESYVRSAKWKIDRQVVLGLLARATLYARQWQKAKDYSDQLLSLNSYIMTEEEWRSGFNSVDNNEWIWGHPQTADQSNCSYRFHFLDTTTPGVYYFSFNVDPYFWEKYDDGDFRKSMIYWDLPPAGNKASDNELYLRNEKFKIRSFDGGNGVGDLVLLRTSEVYLVNAEARARLGDIEGSVEKLNKIRAARGAKLATTSLSQDDLIEEVLLERRRELWAEGFSLQDIIRNQKSVERKAFPATPIDYTYIDAQGVKQHRQIVPQGHRYQKQPDGTDYSVNSKYYLYRIPNSEELANQNLYSNHPKLSIY